MAELNTEAARTAARTALGYSQAFDGKGIDWQNEQPWPHRIELAQALDWITELGAMVLNLADRADAAADMAVVLSMVDKNNRIDAGEKGKAWSGQFVEAEVRRVLALGPNTQVNRARHGAEERR